MMVRLRILHEVSDRLVEAPLILDEAVQVLLVALHARELLLREEHPVGSLDMVRTVDHALPRRNCGCEVVLLLGFAVGEEARGSGREVEVSRGRMLLGLNSLEGSLHGQRASLARLPGRRRQNVQAELEAIIYPFLLPCFDGARQLCVVVPFSPHHSYLSLEILQLVICAVEPVLRTLVQDTESLIVLAVLRDDRVLVLAWLPCQEVVVLDPSHILQLGILRDSGLYYLWLLAVEMDVAHEVGDTISRACLPPDVLAQIHLEFLVPREPSSWPLRLLLVLADHR